MADRLLASRDIGGGVALSAVPRDSVASFDLFARMDLLFDSATLNAPDFAEAVVRVCRIADVLEESILAADRPLATFAKQLAEDVARG